MKIGWLFAQVLAAIGAPHVRHGQILALAQSLGHDILLAAGDHFFSRILFIGIAPSDVLRGKQLNIDYNAYLLLFRYIPLLT